MYTSTEFISALSRHGFDFFTGVPCSFLTPLLNRIISDPGLKYVAATNEGEAVAIAAGAWLADKKTVVSFQNSGLGNAVNPLTSLNYPFNIPTLMIVTLRGEPGLSDEPQHELMGRRTKNILSAIEIPFEHVPSDVANLERVVKLAAETIDHTDRPFALILSKDTFFIHAARQAPESVSSWIDGLRKRDGIGLGTEYVATRHCAGWRRCRVDAYGKFSNDRGGGPQEPYSCSFGQWRARFDRRSKDGFTRHEFHRNCQRLRVSYGNALYRC